MLKLLSQFEDLSNSQSVTEVLFNNLHQEVILSNCQMKTNKKDAKTQNKIKNMQKCKTNLKKTKQYKTNYKQIQYKILKIEKRSKTIKKK